MLDPLTDEQLEEAAKIYLETRNYAELARRLDITRSTAQNRVKQAAKRGFLPTDPVMPGFEIQSVSTQTNGNDEVTSTSVRQVQERGAFNALPKHGITGVSSLLDAGGNVIQQWVKTKAEPDPVETAEAIMAAFDKWEPKRPALVKPKESDSDLLTVYLALDWHLGLMAWGRETDGPDWDLTIAQDVYRRTYADLISQTPKSGKALFLGLGDLFHRDGILPVTSKSGNVLDVDSRYPKMLECGCDLVADILEMVASKHGKVSVVLKHGNHDEAATVGLRMGIRGLFHNTDRIDIDLSPSPFFFDRHGVNLIGGVHGDKTKPKELPIIMANRCAEWWTPKQRRDFHTGHVHHDTLKEDGGVHVYSHRAPVAQDDYHASHAYLSGRSIKAFNYSGNLGYKGTAEVEIL